MFDGILSQGLIANFIITHPASIHAGSVIVSFVRGMSSSGSVECKREEREEL